MNGTRRLLAAAGIAAALLAGGIAGRGTRALPEADAAVPAGAPLFSTPLVIDNPLFPVTPGSIKVFAGREGLRRVTVVERHLEETRTFPWAGGDVECRVVQEMKFTNGSCEEISRTFYAQADDGSVYAFGEIALPPGPPPVAEDGPDEPLDAESTGWVVGAAAPEDPPDTTPGASPCVAMPADPRPGDLWKPEDLFPVVDESDLALRAGLRLRVPAGAFRGVLKVRETTALEPGVETKWYAPGIGAIRGRANRSDLRLQAGTILRR